jgi:hypothetical protein
MPLPSIRIQPNYVVERTVVLRPTEYLRESGCFVGCGGAGYVVNQGQYYDDPFLYSGYRLGGYYPGYRSDHYYPSYRFGRHYPGYRSRYVSLLATATIPVVIVAGERQTAIKPGKLRRMGEYAAFLVVLGHVSGPIGPPADYPGRVPKRA